MWMAIIQIYSYNNISFKMVSFALQWAGLPVYNRRLIKCFQLAELDLCICSFGRLMHFPVIIDTSERKHLHNSTLFKYTSSKALNPERFSATTLYIYK